MASEYTDSSFQSEREYKSIITHRTLVGAQRNKFCWTPHLEKYLKHFLPEPKYWENVDWETLDSKPLKLKPLKTKSNLLPPKFFNYFYCEPDESCPNTSSIFSKLVNTSNATFNTTVSQTATSDDMSKENTQLFQTNRQKLLKKITNKGKYPWSGKTIENSFLLDKSDVDLPFIQEHLKRPKRIFYENRLKQQEKCKDYKEIKAFTKNNIKSILREKKARRKLKRRNRKVNENRRRQVIKNKSDLGKRQSQLLSLIKYGSYEKNDNRFDKKKVSRWLDNNYYPKPNESRRKLLHDFRKTRNLIKSDAANHAYNRAIVNGKVNMKMLDDIIKLYTGNVPLDAKKLALIRQSSLTVFHTTVEPEETDAGDVAREEQEEQSVYAEEEQVGEEANVVVDDYYSDEKPDDQDRSAPDIQASKKIAKKPTDQLKPEEELGEHDEFSDLWLKVDIGRINQDLVKFILRSESSRLSLPFFIYEMFEDGLEQEILPVGKLKPGAKFYAEGEYYSEEESEICVFDKFESEQYVRFHTELQLKKLFTKYNADPCEEIDKKRFRRDLVLLDDKFFIPWKVVNRGIEQIGRVKSAELFGRLPKTESTISQELCFITDLKRQVGPALVRAITQVLLLRPNEKPVEWLVRYLDNFMETVVYEEEANKLDRELMQINDYLFVTRLYKPRRFHTVEYPESSEEETLSEETIETELPIDWDPYEWVRPCKKRDYSILDFLYDNRMSTETFQETPSHFSVPSDDFLSVTSHMTIGSSLYSLSVETPSDLEILSTSERLSKYDILKGKPQYPPGYAMDPNDPPPFEFDGENIIFQGPFRPSALTEPFYQVIESEPEIWKEESYTADYYDEENIDYSGYDMDFVSSEEYGVDYGEVDYAQDYDQYEENIYDTEPVIYEETANADGPIIEEVEPSYDEEFVESDAPVVEEIVAEDG